MKYLTPLLSKVDIICLLQYFGSFLFLFVSLKVLIHFTNNRLARNSSLGAYLVLCCMINGFQAYRGCIYYYEVHYSIGSMDIYATSEARAMLQIPLLKPLLYAGLAYTIIGLMLDIIIGPPVLSFEMVLHHIAMFAAIFISITFPVVQYHAPYFLGVAEISTVPLNVMNIFKYFPSMKLAYPRAYKISRILFAILFILLRVVFWAFHISQWASDYMTCTFSSLSSTLLFIEKFVANNFFSLRFFSSQFILSHNECKR